MSLLRVVNLIIWVITGFFLGLSLYVIFDSVVLSSGLQDSVATVDEPDLYLVQRINEERERTRYPLLRNNHGLTQVANIYTREYQNYNSIYSIESSRLVYDLYTYQYFIGNSVHQIHGMMVDPVSEASLNSVYERLRAYINDPSIEDIGVSITVNDDGSFYYMVMLASTEKLTSPFAYPSFIGEFSQDGQQNAILTMLNNARAERGLSQLRPNRTLMQVAYNHSLDQAQRDRLGHDGSNGSNPNSRITGAGYNGTATGENVLVRPTPYAAGAFDQWWNSPAHFDAMMHPSFREIGIAFARSPNGHYYYTMALGG